MRIVVDASAAVNLILRTERAPALITQLECSSLVLAPMLFHSEIANTLWKYVRVGRLDKDVALTRYEEAPGLVDSFEPDEQLATEALSAAIRYGHPVYDLLYVVLARRYGCKMLTEDSRFATLIRAIDETMVRPS